VPAPPDPDLHEGEEAVVPYVRCAGCGLTSFSVAGWSHIDHCGVCGHELPLGALTRPRRPAPLRAGRLPPLFDAIVLIGTRRRDPADAVSRRLRPQTNPQRPKSVRSSNGTVRATS
jgi:hypothetical protein